MKQSQNVKILLNGNFLKVERSNILIKALSIKLIADMDHCPFYRPYIVNSTTLLDYLIHLIPKVRNA